MPKLPKFESFNDRVTKTQLCPQHFCVILNISKFNAISPDFFLESLHRNHEDLLAWRLFGIWYCYTLKTPKKIKCKTQILKNKDCVGCAKSCTYCRNRGRVFRFTTTDRQLNPNPSVSGQFLYGQLAAVS